MFVKTPQSNKSLATRRGILVLERNGSESHATRGRDGRQEGHERGYYHLHRNLNDSLLHASPPSG